MSCNAVNNSPGLTLCDLEHPLAGRWKSSRIMSRLDRNAVPLSFLGPRSLRPQANDFWREPNTSLILEYFLPCAILFPNFLFCSIYMCSIRKKNYLAVWVDDMDCTHTLCLPCTTIQSQVGTDFGPGALNSIQVNTFKDSVPIFVESSCLGCCMEKGLGCTTVLGSTHNKTEKNTQKIENIPYVVQKGTGHSSNADVFLVWNARH